MRKLQQLNKGSVTSANYSDLLNYQPTASRKGYADNTVHSNNYLKIDTLRNVLHNRDGLSKAEELHILAKYQEQDNYLSSLETITDSGTPSIFLVTESHKDKANYKNFNRDKYDITRAQLYHKLEPTLNAIVRHLKIPAVTPYYLFSHLPQSNDTLTLLGDLPFDLRDEINELTSSFNNYEREVLEIEASNTKYNEIVNKYIKGKSTKVDPVNSYVVNHPIAVFLKDSSLTQLCDYHIGSVPSSLLTTDVILADGELKDKVSNRVEPFSRWFNHKLAGVNTGTYLGLSGKPDSEMLNLLETTELYKDIFKTIKEYIILNRKDELVLDLETRIKIAMDNPTLFYSLLKDINDNINKLNYYNSNTRDNRFTTSERKGRENNLVQEISSVLNRYSAFLDNNKDVVDKIANTRLLDTIQDCYDINEITKEIPITNYSGFNNAYTYYQALEKDGYIPIKEALITVIDSTTPGRLPIIYSKHKKLYNNLGKSFLELKEYREKGIRPTNFTM